MDNLLFIAELGSNWFGSIEVAKYLIDKAGSAGATHIKMQFYPCDELYDKDWKWFQHAKLCELDYDTARILKEHAESIGLGWFASVHTKEDIDFLVDVKAPFIKIKGSQWEDYELLKYIQEVGNIKRTIISIPHNVIAHTLGIQLYTTPIYPSKWNDINFECLKYENIVGFSDHTKGIQASLCAAMYSNINIFEFHFTSDLSKFHLDESKTPDFCVSKYPLNVHKMISRIKHIKGNNE